ncbi:hypothetical protein AOQ84DRAFT_363537 [Glonium stellatum]|uniref:Methyltransferase domain-containing protein n=1 Tax=Glonium stellatum TaxID=574774 RepID=A0A8E2F222_9PEZI|nr:hypothetical protein AOQ84DRAFT_363537 [Glonium stellatum]
MGSVPVDELMEPTRGLTAEQQMIAKMWAICAIEMQDKLRAATCTRPHFERCCSWLAAEHGCFKLPGYPQVPDSCELVAISSEARLKAMTELRERVNDKYMWPLIEGQLKLVKMFLKDGLPEKLHDGANRLSEVRPMFNLMGCSNRKLRILEIGAGTTARALVGLKSDPRQQIEAYDNIEYRALDISRDPREQGFEVGAYDLVIASNISFEKFLFCFSSFVKETVAA